MTTKDNVHPISEADLERHRADAEFRMQNVPMRGVSYDLVAELRKLPGSGGYLLAEPVNHVLHVLKRGLCLYYELFDALGSTVGAQQVAFLGSYALFGLAALVTHDLPAPEGDNLASFPRPEGAFFKVGLGADDDLKALLSLYLKALTQKTSTDSWIVESAEDVISLTRDYFGAARDQMVTDSERLPPELLARIEGTTIRVGELQLQGFTTAETARATAVEWAPVLPEEVVGNSSAKQALLRYVDRLALYDAQHGFNPVLELGGLPSTVLFDGFPGTGKTSLFRMAMTRMQTRAAQVGLPTHMVMVDPSIKDEYYGRTGKLLNERLGLVRDRGALVLVFFDDVDLLLLSRGDPGMGGADKDVLNITMQFLDGAFTKHVGNAQTYAATNEPTATDSALRQRFHHRELIDGPESWQDYARLAQIKLGRQMKHGLIQVAGEPISTGARGAVAKDGEHKPSLAGRWLGRKSVSWQEIGELCVELKRKDPRFTGRPIESVTQRLLAESADFEIPEQWFTDAAAFVGKSYDEKVLLLTFLYRPITGEMIAAALEQYFSSEQRYVTEAKTQRAERMAAEIEAQVAAHKLVAQRDGGQ